MSWIWQGRQLITAEKGRTTLNYTYDSEGVRTSKTVGTVKTSYLLNGTQILAQTTNGKTLCFFYDQQGNRVAMADSSNHIYYYLYNLQGDVIALADASTGKLAATYTYDAWGKIVEINDQVPEDVAETSIAKINPFRYRGYYYDTETELYYLNSRYYDAETGRFINADNAITGAGGDVRGYNLFSYCMNDPVNMSDPTGHWPKLSTIFAVVAVAAVAVAAVATCGAAVPALAVAGGGIIGGISAGAVSTAASVATGAMIVAGVSTTAAVTSAVAEKASNKTAKRNNSVYVLKDDTGTVQYVGRTNNVDRRRAAHSANPARAGLEMEVIASGLNLPESRALEQAGMAYYHTINTANKVNNQINSVSPKYWGAFKELALGTLNYGWNQMSNEILYWTGS